MTGRASRHVLFHVLFGPFPCVRWVPCCTTSQCKLHIRIGLKKSRWLFFNCATIRRSTFRLFRIVRSNRPCPILPRFTVRNPKGNSLEKYICRKPQLRGHRRCGPFVVRTDRKSTRLNSSHLGIS